MRRIGSAYAGIALIGAAFAGGCSFDLAEVVEPAGGPGANILPNPSFEEDTMNWGGHEATIARVQDPKAPSGCCVARVTREATAMDDYFSIENRMDTEPKYVAGTKYEASAWVRDRNPPNPLATFVLHLRENGTDIAKSDYVTIGTTFQLIKVTAVSSCGLPADIHISKYQPTSGDSFDIDLIQIVPIEEHVSVDAGACP